MKKVTVILLVLVLIFSGCSLVGKQTAEEAKPQEQENAGKGNKEQQAYYIGLEAPIKKLDEWVERYKFYPGVFQQEMSGYRVTLISQGERFIPGYEVKVNSVKEKKDRWTVEVALKEPEQKGRDNTGDRLFYPFQVVSVRDDGKPVEVIEKAGILSKDKLPVVKIPQAKELPSSMSFVIFSPLGDEKIESPVTIRGKARVSGSKFTVYVRQGEKALGKKEVNVERGFPDWEDFEVKLPFTKPTGREGEILFFYSTSEDASIMELSIPVKFL